MLFYIKCGAEAAAPSRIAKGKVDQIAASHTCNVAAEITLEGFL